MNWQKEAVNDLKSYVARKMSIDNMNQRIAELERRAIRLGSMSSDVPVQGGSSKNEDAIINNIAERDRLIQAIDAAQCLVTIIENGLSVLDEEERKVLDGFYIHHSTRHVDKLCDELHCEKSRVYSIKDKALYKFTLAMYGVIDL